MFKLRMPGTTCLPKSVTRFKVPKRDKTYRGVACLNLSLSSKFIRGTRRSEALPAYICHSVQSSYEGQDEPRSRMPKSVTQFQVPKRDKTNRCIAGDFSIVRFTGSCMAITRGAGTRMEPAEVCNSSPQIRVHKLVNE